ncbi:hypothetical protein AgCh_026164 [Apium graveolens]
MFIHNFTSKATAAICKFQQILKVVVEKYYPEEEESRYMADKAPYGDEASEAKEKRAGFKAKNGSVIPKKKKLVKTMMAEKIARSFDSNTKTKNNNTNNAAPDADASSD